MDEGKKKASLVLTKADDFDSSVLEKAFPFYKSKPELDDIDGELHPLIRDMWGNGYRTFDCCSGHGKVMGFIMFLPPKKRLLRGAHWETNEPIPRSITELKNVLTSEIILAEGDDFQPFADRLKGVDALQSKSSPRKAPT